MNGVIYLLTCLISGKQYIGQTWDYDERMARYRRSECRGQPALHAAIRKYGWENFTCVIIAQGIQTQPALDATERAFIRLLDTLAPNGYNLMSGGKGGKHNAETKAKIGDAHRGKSVSDETRAKMSAASRGRPKSPETRAKLSAAPRGKKHTAETRAKMSASQKARHASKRKVML